MQIHVLKSKIHRASVTASNLNYEGSMSVDTKLMELAGFHPYEKILCGNMSNGNRFETYLIPGEPGTGAIVLNGATAHLGKVGDLLTIMGYAMIDRAEARHWQPQVVVLGPKNQVVNQRGV